MHRPRRDVPVREHEALRDMRPSRMGRGPVQRLWQYAGDSERAVMQRTIVRRMRHLVVGRPTRLHITRCL